MVRGTGVPGGAVLGLSDRPSGESLGDMGPRKYRNLPVQLFNSSRMSFIQMLRELESPIIAGPDTTWQSGTLNPVHHVVISSHLPLPIHIDVQVWGDKIYSTCRHQMSSDTSNHTPKLKSERSRARPSSNRSLSRG